MERLRAKLSPLLLLAGFASCYIETYNETYFCEDPIVVHVPPHLNFSENCKAEWTELPTKIAIASSATSSKPQCRPPCVGVSGKQLTLSKCSQVELIISCFDNNEVYEKRIVFSGIYYIPLIGVLVVILVFVFWYNIVH